MFARRYTQCRNYPNRFSNGSQGFAKMLWAKDSGNCRDVSSSFRLQGKYPYTNTHMC